MKYTVALLLFLLFGFHTAAQTDTLTLSDCFVMAEKHHPLSAAYQNAEQIRDLNMKNHGTNYLPKADFEASAGYQSETVSLDLNAPIPGLVLPEPPLEHYDIGITVSQLIWDGGVSKQLKKAEEIKYELMRSQTDIKIYQVKQAVQQSYFSVLILEEAAKQIQSSLALLKSKRKTVQSAISNGVLTPDNEDALAAEIVRLEQQLTEMRYNIQTAKSLLAELTGDTAITEKAFIRPKTDGSFKADLPGKRPEEALFDSRNNLYQRQIAMTNAGRRPKLAAFVKGAYGNPGLNMFADEWGPYYMAGISLKWHIYDWNNAKRQKEILVIQSRSNELERDAFHRQIETELIRIRNEIEKLETLRKSDEEIVRLRKSVTRQSASRLENGTITSVEYAEAVNAENNAIIQMKIRELKIVNEQCNYLRVLNLL